MSPRPSARATPVTYTFLGLCFAVTVPTLIDPGLYDVFGGIEPRRYPWQLFTAVLEHGFPGFPGIVHLGLNTVLILAAGPPCERLLGSGRFLLLCLTAAAANAGLQLLGEGVNGSSLVIWSWGPPLAWGLYQAGKTRGVGVWEVNPGITGILIIMYVAVTMAMTFLPYLAGWRGHPLTAFLLGNQYHLAATAVGAAAVPFLAPRIAARSQALASE